MSAAARRLGLAQATVRSQVEALEHALGTVLFTRSARGLFPTEHAKSLGDAARAMGRASETFVRTAASRHDQPAGVVRLSVSDFVGVEVLPPMLASLRQRFPELIIEIVLSNRSANLLEQEVDLAIRMHPPRQDALVTRKVGAIPIALFAHRDYIARRGAPATIEDLVTHDLIGSDKDQAFLAVSEAVFPMVKRANYVVRTDNHPAQLAAARAGLGIVAAQRPVGLADSNLVPVLPDLVITKLETWIVTHENLRHLPRVRAVFDMLVEQFQRMLSEKD
ncbi:LysR family transcriptional regulator [Devosia pacifica]|uniref:LysR family transcriptional regulator n=1 Tax=Devosia pacifica TaxID=1335967 RepID=A0A918VN08_9HYPH|nr:LysR family transcriptional regulator [Devosia pacifica]